MMNPNGKTPVVEVTAPADAGEGDGVGTELVADAVVCATTEVNPCSTNVYPLKVN